MGCALDLSHNMTRDYKEFNFTILSSVGIKLLPQLIVPLIMGKYSVPNTSIEIAFRNIMPSNFKIFQILKEWFCVGEFMGVFSRWSRRGKTVPLAKWESVDWLLTRLSVFFFFGGNCSDLSGKSGWKKPSSWLFYQLPNFRLNWKVKKVLDLSPKVSIHIWP